jgi:hypothetical protein
MGRPDFSDFESSVMVGCVEFTGFRNNLEKPIGKVVDATAARTVGQRAAEHLHDVLSSLERFHNSRQVGAH